MPEDISLRIKELLSTLASPELVEEDPSKFQKITDGPSIAFTLIDGGSAEIISSPVLSILYNRVCSIDYDGNKKSGMRREEFWTLVTLGEDLLFRAETSGLDLGLDLVFDPDDPLLKQGRFPAGISMVGNIVRRLAELRAAASIPVGSVPVLDGSLEESYPFERDLLRPLLKRPSVGLSKTTNQLAPGKRGLPGGLLMRSPTGGWFFPSGGGQGYGMYFTRLSPASRHVFRIDLSKDAESMKEKIFTSLSENSRDPVFPGYPYGLILADRLARISNQEKARLRLQVLSRLRGAAEDILRLESSQDAHSILDSIS